MLRSAFEKDPSDGLVLTSAEREFQSLEPTTGTESLHSFVLTIGTG